MILGSYLSSRVAATRADIARMQDEIITHDKAADELRAQVQEARFLLDFLLKDVIETNKSAA